MFQLFSDTLDSLVMKSRAEGAYDEGICEIKGRVLTFDGDPEVILKAHLGPPRGDRSIRWGRGVGVHRQGGI